MKCVRFMTSIIFAALLPAEAIQGQTLLSTGDIAIIGLHHDDFSGTGGPPKSLSFVTWVDIAPATIISFTDNGWLSPEGVFRLSEGLISWTASVAVSAGTVVVLPGAMVNFNLSTAGDQVFAFQGSIDGGTGALTGTLIFGINNNGAGVWQSTASDTNTSALPDALNVSGGSLALNEVDNAQYTGPRSGFANFAAAKAAVLNLANWSFSDADGIGPLDDTSFTNSSGDYNGDGTVDAADYTVWRDALSAGASELTNDPTPGVVDESDFLYWRDHFGATFGSGAGANANATIPEPATLVLLMASAASWCLRRRRAA